MPETVEWLRKEFEVCEIDSDFAEEGGIVDFAELVATGRWKAYFVDRTRSLRTRIPSTKAGRKQTP